MNAKCVSFSYQFKNQFEEYYQLPSNLFRVESYLEYNLIDKANLLKEL